MQVETALQFQATEMFVVPKRQFKKAHDRNLLKRRMREAYRLNKLNFYQQLSTANVKVVCAFIYVGKKQEEYITIEKAIKQNLNSVTLN